VSWRAEIPTPTEGGALPPTFCYASWSIPDSTRQRRLFGRVLLRGGYLMWYGTMFADLDAARQREWDRMLTALKPGDLSPLERFRFADERLRGAPARDTTTLAAPLVKLILDAAKREP
jgi:hypothetical protein